MEKTAVNPILNRTQQFFIVTDSQFRIINHKNGNGLRESLNKLQAQQCSIFNILPDLEHKKSYLEKILSRELSQFEMKSMSMKLSDGQTTNVKVIITPNDDFGEKNGLIVTVRKLPSATQTASAGAAATEQIKTEALKSDFDISLQFIVDSLPINIFYHNIDKDELYFNRAFQQYFNVPRNHISVSALKRSKNGLFDKLLTLNDKVLAGESTENEFVKIETASGAKTFKINHITRSDQSGKIAGILYYGTDVTNELQAYRELENEKLLLQALMDNMPDTIYFKDTEGRFTRINQAQADALGVKKPEDAIGKTDFDFFAPEFATAAYQDEQRIIKTKQPMLGKEEKVERTGGWSRWVSASKVPILDENGNVTGIVGVSRDITDLHEAKEKLKAQNEQLDKARKEAEIAMKERTAFVANMSHEIRTPMNGVIGMTNLLMQTNLDEEQKEYAEIILSSGDTLLHVINDILDFSRIESGAVELENQPFALRLCLEECLDLHAAAATNKGLELAYYIKNPCPKTVVGDKARLLQVLNNLVSNAIKFTASGEVIIQVSSKEISPGNFILEFKVKDTGIGIPAEAQQKLFKPFSQVDSSTSRKYGGTGLGLVISKLLVQLMGGQIGFVSKENVGTTFSFTIKAEGRDMKDFDDHSLLASQLAGKQIAIVDDNKTNRRILSLQTKSWGMKPVEFEDGREVIEALKSGKTFDLGILDLLMPEINGIDVAKEFAKHPKGAEIPLILLTSVGWHRESIENDDLNIKQFLTKPVKQSKLFDTIANIFSKKRVEAIDSKDASVLSKNIAAKWPLDILLAEDNPVNQKFALRTLEKLGYKADLAENGLEVLKALEKKAYDLILMDIQMPEMDGVETTIIIRSRVAEEVRPQIVALTAHAMPGDREKYLSLGLDDYISKPIKLEELIRVLKSCKPKNGSAISGLSDLNVPADGELGKPEITLSELKETLGFGEAEEDSFVFELVEVFIKETSDLLNELSASVKNGDIKTVCRIVHTLKSSSQTIGINNLTELADQIYQNADNYTQEELESITGELAEQTQKVIANLKSLHN